MGRFGAAGGLLLGSPGGPGGIRAGREGIWGGAPKASLVGIGLDGMGGAPNGCAGTAINGGPGVGPRTPGGRLGGPIAECGRRWGLGLCPPD